MAFLQHVFPISSTLLQEDIQNRQIHSFSFLFEEMCKTRYDKVVIAGPDRADKTSLVFQAAVSGAAAGGHVAYICTHPLKSLPLPIHGMMTPEPSVMKNVDFLYLEDSMELIEWCAGVHTKIKQPSLLIIEDILTYASQIDEQNMERSLAKLCAVISNTVSWLASHNDLKACSVLLTAPSRVTSLGSVLDQFHFKVATYQGPQKDKSTSMLSVTDKRASLCVEFCHKKDCLMVTDVYGSMVKD